VLVGVPVSSTLGASAPPGPVPPANVRVVAGQALGVTRGTLRPGTKVSPSRLGRRVFVDGRHGFALDSSGQATYAAATSDGGRIWRTSSPALVLHAAQAPLEVSEIGAVSTRLYFAGGAEAVDVTPDGGRHWYRSLLPGAVLAVFQSGMGQGLAAIVESLEGEPANWVYLSTDGGRHWRYEPKL
jgi:photosystem II stability/assembly factor-like uncharacterized protein